MIELNRHIEILLLSNDCVIVPEFGGFVAHHVAARYDEADNTFLPPLRTLGFNPQLRINDHLLVQSYVEAHDLSYPEALRRIEAEVEELKQHLERNGEFELADIGMLRMNEEGNYEFSPCEAGILSPSLYGLGSFSMEPLSELQQEEAPQKESVEPASATIVDIDKDKDKERDSIVVRMSWIRNTIAFAASVLIFFLISSPVSNSGITEGQQQSSMLPILTVSAPQVAPLDASLPAMESSDSIVTAQEPTVEEAEETLAATDYYTIVMASETPMHHAQTFIESLTKSGIEEARAMNMLNSSKLRVVVGSFPDEESAHQQLRTYRAGSKLFKEAWVLHVKD